MNNLCDEFNEIYLCKTENDYNNLETLDDVTLFCYKKVCSKTANIKESDFPYQLQNNKNLLLAIKRMIENVDNSINVYKTELENISLKHPKLYKELRDNSELRLIQLRNQKRNFLSIDAQLIDLIPFCLWYREKYKMVITISGGRLFEDVAIPLLLNPEKSVFIADWGYENKVKELFKNHGNNTEVIVVLDKSTVTVEDYEMKINQIIENSGLKENDIVINLGTNISYAAVMAAYKKSEYCTIISYRYPQITCYNKTLPECYCMNNKNLTVDEYVKLCRWDVTNSDIEVMKYNECKNISDFFWKTSESKKIPGTKIFYTIWEKLHSCYKIAYKNENEKIVNAGDELSICWNVESYSKNVIHEDIKQKIECYMPKMIEELSKYDIIDKINCNDNDKTAKVKIKNDKVYEILAKKSGTLFENIVYYKCKYSGLFNDVKTGVKILKTSNVANANKDTNTNNEIDVIATKGIRAIFISCKTTAFLDNEYVYEIAAESYHFGGTPVIAVSQTLKNNIPFVQRAKNLKVSLLDAKIIKRDDYFNCAIRRILNGEIVSPLDPEFHAQ